MSYQILFYWNERGDSPVCDFLDSLPVKARAKIAAWIGLLEKEGPSLKRPYADKLKDKLYELRVRLGPDNVRIIYFFYLKDRIILLHAFRKKDWKVDQRDIEVSENRMSDFMDRYLKGRIQL